MVSIETQAIGQPFGKVGQPVPVNQNQYPWLSHEKGSWWVIFKFCLLLFHFYLSLFVIYFPNILYSIFFIFVVISYFLSLWSLLFVHSFCFKSFILPFFANHWTISIPSWKFVCASEVIYFVLIPVPFMVYYLRTLQPSHVNVLYGIFYKLSLLGFLCIWSKTYRKQIYWETRVMSIENTSCV